MLKSGKKKPRYYGLGNDSPDDAAALVKRGRQRGAAGAGAGAAGEYTVEDAVEAMGFGWFQWKIFLVCGLFSATDALEMLLLSVLSPELRCEWMLSEWKVALITTVSRNKILLSFFFA